MNPPLLFQVGALLDILSPRVLVVGPVHRSAFTAALVARERRELLGGGGGGRERPDTIRALGLKP